MTEPFAIDTDNRLSRRGSTEIETEDGSRQSVSSKSATAKNWRWHWTLSATASFHSVGNTFGNAGRSILNNTAGLLLLRWTDLSTTSPNSGMGEYSILTTDLTEEYVRINKGE